jgi:hypothetical protein
VNLQMDMGISAIVPTACLHVADELASRDPSRNAVHEVADRHASASVET